jgi:hypothetical protein
MAGQRQKKTAARMHARGVKRRSPLAGGGSRAGTARAEPALGSATAFAAEALRTGIVGARRLRGRPVSRVEDEKIRFGDPDDDSLANEYVGDETPGGSAPTPDQSVIDEIGWAYGLQEEDAGDLHCAAEILERRDRHRWELRPPKTPTD